MFKRNQINPILSLNYGDNSPSTRGKRPHVNAVRQNGPIFSNCIPLTNFINGTHSNAPTECDELSKGTYFLDATSSSHLYNSNSLSHQIPFTLLPDYTNKFEQDNSIHSPNILSNMCIPNNQFFSQMFSERNDEINSPLLHPFNEDKYANSMHCLPEQTMIHLPLLSGDDVEETFTNLLSKNPLCESSNSVSSLEKCDTLEAILLKVKTIRLIKLLFQVHHYHQRKQLCFLYVPLLFKILYVPLLFKLQTSLSQNLLVMAQTIIYPVIQNHFKKWGLMLFSFFYYYKCS